MQDHALTHPITPLLLLLFFRVNENSVPSVMAYGKYDKMQSFEASIRLADALNANDVPHEYIVCEHSGHGLQNDNKQYGLYMEKVCEYLEMYMPVD